MRGLIMREGPLVCSASALTFKTYSARPASAGRRFTEVRSAERLGRSGVVKSWYSGERQMKTIQATDDRRRVPATDGVMSDDRREGQRPVHGRRRRLGESLLHQAFRVRARSRRLAGLRRGEQGQPTAAARRSQSSAGRPMPDGRKPEPGAEPHPLRRRRHRSRGRSPPRGRRHVSATTCQCWPRRSTAPSLFDPSGNPIDIFQPAA